MTKKRDTEVSKKGAVELTEDSLDQAQGGILIGLKPTDSLAQKVDLAKSAVKLDNSALKIADGTSNTIKF